MRVTRQGGAHLATSKEGTPKRPKRVYIRKSQSIRRERKLSASKIAVITVAGTFGILVFALVLFVNSKLNLLNYSDGKYQGNGVISDDQKTVIDTSNLDDWDAPKESTLEIADAEGVFNILLLGTDGLELDFVDQARADSIILLSINFEDKTAKLTSFQRGIGMPIQSGEFEGQYDLITHIFAHGGADMIMQDIRECFKINVDKYVRVNFSALIKVIDVLGGVDVEINELEAWYLNQIREGKSVEPYINHGFIRGDGSGEDYPFVVGENHMTGSMALAYSRLRAIDSDWHRIERQRTVLQACADGLKNADLATLNELANEILPLVQTNLKKTEIAELMLRAPGLLGIQFEQLSLPEEGSYGGMTGIYQQDMLAVDFDYNSKLLHEFIYGEA